MSQSNLQRSFAWMSFMPFATTLVVTLIGVAAIATLGEGVPQDEVMPRLLGEWAEQGTAATFGAVVVFLGALAAIMSTADSCLLSLGALAARDLLDRPTDDDQTTRVGKWLAGGILLAMVPLALQGDITLWRLIELKMELLIQCVPAFLLGLHWARLRAAPVLAGLLVGTVFSAGLTLAGITRVGGAHIGMVGLLLNTTVAVVGSLLHSAAGGAKDEPGSIRL